MDKMLGALIQTRRIKKVLENEKQLCKKQKQLLTDQEDDLLDQIVKKA